MENIKVTVITVCYNAYNTIENTITSIINQDYRNIEFIVIDGNSKDKTIDIVQKYKNRINKIISEPDKGIYDAMNKGIALATGDYCIFMNSGDSFFDYKSVSSAVPFLTENSDIVSGIATLENQIWYPAKESELSLSFFVTKSLNHQATFIKTTLLKKIGYDSSLKIVADSIFFFKILILGNGSYKAIPVNIAKCEDSGMSGDREASYKELQMAIKTLLPQRMSKDVDFIHYYCNPAVIKIGNLLHKCKWLKKIWHFYKRHQKVR
ncbi:glycosyltransferase [Phocaeicola plebeius]|uniref:glycosyltransferase family 2 protein n=1 Tax=Phocaeicola plebeius TaxID=310297 RepID=UPI001958AB64|nr:glycosyltransferase family 2 protein [Phocaeicola plebeius]MBM6963901.1 glycosyltransferase [Phocaeicola plebeius]